MNIEKIDNALYNTAINYIGGSYTGELANYIRIFKDIYDDFGYMFYLGGAIAEYNIYPLAKLSYSGTNFSKLQLFEQIAKQKGGVMRRFLNEVVVFTEDFMLNEELRVICTYENIVKVREYLFPFFFPNESNQPYFKYLTCSSMGIDYKKISIKKMECDLSLNYNDDLPHEKLTKALHDDSSSISILHGNPGTGKTYFIRKLIDENKDLEFYWLDAKMLTLNTNSDFIDFLYDHTNAVYILEDCEHLLRSREEGDNSILSTLLNISDGMLGDALNIKFLCTFNADLDKIDSAILRKGRLKVKYEFKELTKEKVKALAEHLGINIPNIKPMPLCEIYNYEYDNGVVNKTTNKIGFA